MIQIQSLINSILFHLDVPVVTVYALDATSSVSMTMQYVRKETE